MLLHFYIKLQNIIKDLSYSSDIIYLEMAKVVDKIDHYLLFLLNTKIKINETLSFVLMTYQILYSQFV